ncbi:putative methionyl-tRNA synthetase [Hordeum vulgare]|nr:putative methionyl-tRNA synthetase [Hordeum vulgare]
MYSGSSAMALRRGDLAFAPGSTPHFSNVDAEMDDIIANGSAASASCHGFYTQEDTLDIVDDMKVVEPEEEVEEEQPTEPEPVTEGRKKQRASNSKSAEPRVKWTPKEDECLAGPNADGAHANDEHC